MKEEISLNLSDHFKDAIIDIRNSVIKWSERVKKDLYTASINSIGKNLKQIAAKVERKRIGSKIITDERRLLKGSE